MIPQSNFSRCSLASLKPRPSKFSLSHSRTHVWQKLWPYNYLSTNDISQLSSEISTVEISWQIKEKAEEAINRGIEPTLAQLGLTIDEVQADFNEMEATEHENDDIEHEEHANVPAPELEIDEPEAEGNVSHLSSNLSEPGLCDPENPCLGEEPCRHLRE